MSEVPSNKRQRTATASKEDNNGDNGAANISDLAPFVAAALRDGVMADMQKEKRELDEKLLSVELIGENGEVLWKCNDIRKGGHRQELEYIESGLSFEKPEECSPGNVWTIPVHAENSTKRSPLVLSKPDQVKEVRVGLHRWKAGVADTVGIGKYDPTRKSHPMRLPIVTENYKRKGDDVMGSDALYLHGEYTVTNPQILTWHADESEDRAHFSGEAYDATRTAIDSRLEFVGRHDELCVNNVDLVISGNVQGTLELYNL